MKTLFKKGHDVCNQVKNKKYTIINIYTHRNLFLNVEKEVKVMEFDFDVITIGGGIIGAAISDELAKRKINVVILEKNLRTCLKSF